MDLHTLPVYRLSELMARKEVSSEEITRAHLECINRTEDRVKAMVTVTAEAALDQARAVDDRRAAGEELSSLAGVPMAIIDNICTMGVKTTCASHMLYNFIPPYDAEVVSRLKDTGAILMGKCNMDEFSIGPADEERGPQAPASRSDGGAAAVAAGEAAFVLGADTEGSLRQSAARCGVIGLKPTYGRVSRYGLISYASSLDQIGPLVRDMQDLALVLNAICGHDARDSTAAAVKVPDYRKCLINDVRGLKVGLPLEYLAHVEPQSAAVVRQAADRLAELGAICREVSMPHTAYALPAHYIISAAEASSNLARYDGVRYGFRVDDEDVQGMFSKSRGRGFGRAVKTRIMLGTYVLSAANYDDYYVKALKTRTLVQQDFERVFEKCDCLLAPTGSGIACCDPAADLSATCDVAANLAGLPSLSLPFGLVDGLPVGLQFMARHFDEEVLLRVGYTWQENTKHKNKP
ncbi:MAG: Asp-tRNA(Asn)/Glu-tRNA(Gln) amidotransferase subunit GatA [Peptococcaceae bacterium]|nr:Asp-tRNA(Asn)/Glu-tRNA(Gln) amidotransferase subunit GatA [Candidatus Syntrophopropionicum ammoniitolerans]